MRKNVCGKVFALKWKLKSLRKKKVAESDAEFVFVKWKVEKKLNRGRKVFVVTLRDNETQTPKL